MRVPAIFGLALLLGACVGGPESPNLEEIYREARLAREDRSPIVTVPGVLGSRLADKETRQFVWGGGGSRGVSADPEDPEEFRIMALPVGDGRTPLLEVRDNVVSAGILDVAEVDILGVPLLIDIYRGATQLLGQGGFTPDTSLRGRRLVGAANEMPDAFSFDYDWRRDIVESAHKLGRFLQARRKEIALDRGVAPETVRFDVLAHSMGGLVTRYFLMYGFAEPPTDGTVPPVTWAGASLVNRVIFIAPPNAGSITALSHMVNGVTFGPFQPFYPPALMATYPSTYQLMPRNRHQRLRRDGRGFGDLYDVEMWDQLGWGLLGKTEDAETHREILMPDQDPAVRRARARAYTAQLLARAQTFHRMMDQWKDPPEEVELFLVVGGGFETPAWAEVDTDGVLDVSGLEEGDGTVLRTSALLDERLDGITGVKLRSPLRFNATLFLPDEHTDIVKNPVFGDNLLFWLLEAPRGADRLRSTRDRRRYLAPRGTTRDFRLPSAGRD